MRKSIILFILTYFFPSLLAEDLLVYLPIGHLKGTKIESTSATFYAFLQIPYGAPPIGELKFQAPKPAEPWKGTLNATVSNRICFQRSNTLPTGVEESEMCLYLNVYTPKLPNENNNLPAMVYFHGGSFSSGSAAYAEKGPHYFMEYEVLIVTVNYRLGPWGFMAFNDELQIGNGGLKDQILALEWVRDNIKYFGGDPKKVTIFGNEAGGASVVYHLLSTQSTGLYRAAIAQSGSALCPWAYQRDFTFYPLMLATNAKPDMSSNATETEIFEFLKTLPGRSLKMAFQDLEFIVNRLADKFFFNRTHRFTVKEHFGHEQITQGFFFTPTVETEESSAFISARMYSILNNGHMNKVPLMIGITSEELLTVASNITNLEETADSFDEFSFLLPNNNMHLPDFQESDEAGEIIKKMYTNENFRHNLGALIKYYSDMAFSRSIIRTAELHSKHEAVYFYQFSHHGRLGNDSLHINGADRVPNGEDEKYLWVKNGQDDIKQYPEPDRLTSKRYLTLLTNFAKHSNPTPEEDPTLNSIIWPKFTEIRSNYLNINTSLSLELNPKSDVYSKWVELYENMGIQPFDTF